ncbi:tyrosine/dopa decarboxylase [Trifolium medium]|uniref:Tyrosine/dopa decarboxylase n=1 Tax=Trifolium medium TaxID=97028 RepID=A0A392MSR5_9FABA|nr:tyrosine/dopa decarboxylase [Trifolium medium]
MVVKVMVRKSTKEFLFAEAQEDFIDFLFSFLTFPLGGVLEMLKGFSSLSCIDNLYKSMTELSPERYLISQDIKDKLTKPQCAPHFSGGSQILPICAASLPVYYCHTYYNEGYCADLTKEKLRSKNSTSVPDKFVPFKLKSVGLKHYFTGLPDVRCL